MQNQSTKIHLSADMAKIFFQPPFRHVSSPTPRPPFFSSFSVLLQSSTEEILKNY